MWTPKGIIQFILSLILILLAYGVYSTFLGRFDSLPPLPEALFPADKNASATVTKPPNNSYGGEKNQLVVEAFGAKCPELYRNIIMYDMGAETRYLFCFEQHRLENGHLVLSDVSVATFKQKPNEETKKNKQDIREIVTLRGESAVIRFEKPIRNISDFAIGSKDRNRIIGGTISKKVRLHHNRGTSAGRDDIFMDCDDTIEITDELRRIITPITADVHVTLGEPSAAQVHGKGMEIELLPAKPESMTTAAGKAAGKRDAGLGIAGVRWMKLCSDVSMVVPQTQSLELFGQAQKQLMGNDPKKEAARASTSQSLVVKCKDNFIYHMEKQTADFDQEVNVNTKRVVVVNGQEKTEYDTLDCQHLMLEFIKAEKNQPDFTKPAASDNDPQLSLRSITATGQVHITSDSRSMVADANSLHHDHETGLTILRGKPDVIVQLKDYKLTQTGEIQLQASKSSPSKLSEVKGIGPGTIRWVPVDADPKLAIASRMAQWNSEFRWTITPDREIVRLIGGTTFIDPRWGNMKADSLAVTLTPDTNKTSTPVSGNKNEMSMERLQKIQAEGQVTVTSARLNIPKTQKLTLEFTDANSPLLSEPVAEPGRVMRQEDKGLVTLDKPERPENQKPPIQLEAETIQAMMRFVPGKKEPQLVFANAQKSVKIQQNDANNASRNLLVTGDSLHLQQQETDLYYLHLMGPKCEVQAEKYQLSGPDIEVNQLQNRMMVAGAGELKMLTKTDIKGEKVDVPLWTTFRWMKSLEFDKKTATFLGQVTAEQQTYFLSCGRLIATLDQPISFQQQQREKDQTKPGDQPGIQSVICDDPDAERNRARVLVDYRINPGTANRMLLRIEGVRLTFETREKETGMLLVIGPGEINMVRQGVPLNDLNTTGQPIVPNRQPQLNNKADAFKLTRILFDDKFTYDYNTSKNPTTRVNNILNFYENVRVFYVPGEDINMQLDPQKLPVGGIFISCKKLTEYQYRIEGSGNVPARYAHEMAAQENVSLRTPDYQIVSDTLKYKEAEAIIRIEANPGNVAKVIPQKQKALNARTWPSRGFVYYLKTGELESYDYK